MSTTPRLSVVVPHWDPRAELGFLEGWTRRQTADPALYEVVVARGTTSPLPPAEIEARLRPHDTLLPVDACEWSNLAAAGVEASRGEVVVLTEDHCSPNAGCVAAVLRAFDDDPTLEAAGLRRGEVAKSLNATLEAAYGERQEAAIVASGHWNIVRIRGFAVRRRTLEAIGGIAADASLFSETLLGAALRRHGITLGQIPDAAVAHSNSTKRRNGQAIMRKYVIHEVAHCATHDPAEDDLYFPRGPLLLRGDVLPAGDARRLASELAAAAVAPGAGAARLLAAREAARTVATPVVARATAAAAVARHRMRARLLRGERQVDAFSDGWEAAARRFRVQAITAGSAPLRVTPAGTYRGADLALLDGYGWHAVEYANEPTIRWTAPRWTLRLDLPAGAHTVTVDVAGVRGDLALLPMVATWGRHVVPVERAGDRLSLTVQGGAARDLVVVVAPFDARAGGDSRRLGLPVVAVGIGT